MILFVTATDTGVGKTYATGLLARAFMEAGLKVITQKPVQTGSNYPEDLLIHRQLMGLSLEGEDLLSLTNPYLFSYPAAPATAASLEGKEVSFLRIKRALSLLEEEYDVVLVEGAGGIWVPFTPEESFLDLLSLFLAPVIVVSPAKLGTINHTVLTIQALRQRGLFVYGLVYNLFFSHDNFLTKSSLEEIQKICPVDNILTLPPISPPLALDLIKQAQKFLRFFLP